MSPSWKRLIRFEAVEGGIHYGEPVAASLAADGSLVADAAIKATEVSGLFDGVIGEKVLTVKKLLSPLESTPAIACIGINYKEHHEEAAEATRLKLPENPVLFHKFPGALAGSGTLVLPKTTNDGQMDYEAELVVIIGKKGKNIPVDKALDHVLGYTCGNDLSARKWQFACGGQFNFGKGMDGFSPIGPMIVRADVLGDPQNLRIRSILNGATMQDSTTQKMIFDVKYLVSFLSKGTTLYPGTIILSGTPAGVGFVRNPVVALQDGDVCDVVIDKIGTLRNEIKYVSEDAYEL